MLGTCAQHVPDGGSPDGGPGTGFGAAFWLSWRCNISNKIHKMTRHPTIYSKPKTNKTHSTFKELLFQIAPAGGGGPAGGAPHTAPGVCPGTIFGPGGGPDNAAPTVIVGRPGEPGVFGPGGGPSGFASSGTAGTGFGSASPVKQLCRLQYHSLELPKIGSFHFNEFFPTDCTWHCGLYLFNEDRLSSPVLSIFIAHASSLIGIHVPCLRIPVQFAFRK